ncbi:MAG: DNA recombination protein RmuC [Candidatus Tectomicrobia bacterium]|uniref:DNA recombination protein RmuC n=1 Tax=Tectimicrobiota bacterium TaxID=2528274 RepID=A0A932GNE7_UNCTE|nr:DNA recombination protein RmuC [Candidatus Tectomicrobia bacterium]
MYIPAENVYYETIIKDEGSDGEGSLSDFALQQRVIPVSPNSFYAYLQAIVLGLKGLRVEKNARDIMVHLSRLQGDLRRFRDDFSVLGKHLSNARNKYEEAQAALTRIETKLEGMGSGDSPLESPPKELPSE